jgi:hypothetical protein
MTSFIPIPAGVVPLLYSGLQLDLRRVTDELDDLLEQPGRVEHRERFTGPFERWDRIRALLDVIDWPSGHPPAQAIVDIDTHRGVLLSALRFSGDDDFLFQCSTPRRPMNYKQLLEHFHDARKTAGLNDVTFHALRHTFASILIAQDRDVQFVSRQLGHTKTSTTWDTYVHLFEARRHAQDARDALEAEYGDMLNGVEVEGARGEAAAADEHR